MLNRTLLVAATLTAAVGLAACDSGTTTTAPAPGPTPSTAPATAVDAAKVEIEKLIDQATTYIKENKLDLAEKAIAEIDANKSKIPADLQPRVEQLKSALETAKKAGVLTTTPKIPG